MSARTSAPAGGISPGGTVRVPAAARRLGLTTLELYLRIDAGQVPAVRDKRGMIAIPASVLDSLDH